MSDVRADLEALISEATDLLLIPDDLLAVHEEDVYAAFEGIAAVADAVHEMTRKVVPAA